MTRSRRTYGLCSTRPERRTQRGEGATIGVHPQYEYRSCYGTPNSTGNAVYLLALRLALIRESFNLETGLPEGLDLAYATPREWLADGKEITVKNAPTCFGTLSYSIRSRLAQNRAEATVSIPDRNRIGSLTMKIRTPGRRAISGVRANGEEHRGWSRESEVMDLSGHTGTLRVDLEYER